VLLAPRIVNDSSVIPETSTTLSGGNTFATDQTFVLSGQTLDGVPGGFGTLRAGESVLVIADLAKSPVAASYITDITSLVYSVAPSAAARSRFATSPDNVLVSPAAAKPRRVRLASTGSGGSVPFLLEGKTGPVPDFRITGIQVPQSVFAVNIPFYSISHGGA
jgi:hypothetical protein